MSIKNGMIAGWSKKASLRPSAAALVCKFPILALYIFVSSVIVYVTVPVSTLKIEVARTAVLVRSGTHILSSDRRENRKRQKKRRAGKHATERRQRKSASMRKLCT